MLNATAVRNYARTLSTDKSGVMVYARLDGTYFHTDPNCNGMQDASHISLLTAFSGEKLRSITFWTMGSLSGAGYTETLVLLGALAVFGGVLLSCADELNAFSLGEDAARHMGVAVGPVKLGVLVCVASLIGVCVSVGGSIGFVGLIVPHAARLFTGASHRRLLPLSLFMGAIFLMLADLLARTVVSPIELPIGVVTSLVGAVVFVVIFFRRRRLCWK